MVQKLGADVRGEAPPENDLCSDLVWGVSAIAKTIGRRKRQVYNFLNTGNLPAQKLGLRYDSSRSALREHFAALISREIV